MHAGALALGAGGWGAVQALVRCAPTAPWIVEALDRVSAELVVTLLYVTVETTAWNAWPVQALAWAAARKAWRRFYDVGIVCAGVCLVAMIGVLLTMCTQLLEAPALAKRSVASEWTLVPVVRAQLTQIPGVTVPLTYAIPLILALLVSQGAHEAGHALAAGLHRIKPLAMGLTVVVPLIPIAHVALPRLEGRLTRREQLRIVSAGVWHNACILIVLYAVLVSGMAHVFWTDAQALRITRSADAELREWLPAGARIRSINDRELAPMPPAARREVWEAMLHNDLPPAQGWCIEAPRWANASDACCAEPTPVETCFKGDDARCLPTSDVLLLAARCNTTCDGVCVRPAPHESLAWLLLDVAPSTEQVILRGPFDTLPAYVAVSTERLVAWLRVWGLEAIGDAVAYLCSVLTFSLTIVNTTLCLLNMLPIAPLDGGAYIRLVLAETYAWRHGDASDTFALDADEEEAEEVPWAARVERVLRLVQVTTYALCAMALVRSLATALHYVR
ncbi:hypothetical protein CBS9595_001167 [Malassezia furfur]|nr:hypothetical protein CBS9595_001167 [Malassezia furfur]